MAPAVFMHTPCYHCNACWTISWHRVSMPKLIQWFNLIIAVAPSLCSRIRITLLPIAHPQNYKRATNRQGVAVIFPSCCWFPFNRIGPNPVLQHVRLQPAHQTERSLLPQISLLRNDPRHLRAKSSVPETRAEGFITFCSRSFCCHLFLGGLVTNC